MKIPANRVAVLAGLLTAIGGFVASCLGAVDTAEKAAVLCVALVVAGAVLIVYLVGYQKHEARQAGKVHAGSSTAPALVTRKTS